MRTNEIAIVNYLECQVYRLKKSNCFKFKLTLTNSSSDCIFD